MRAHVPSYDVVAPASLADALAMLAAEPGVWTPLAGGTDLMVVYEAGRLPPGRFMSIWRLEELRGIEVSDDAVEIGALATYADVRDHAVMRAEYPMLVQAARESGAVAIQNRGTLGGNIINASPAADSPPALVAYDAEIELVSASGSRWVPYRDFHTGYKEMDRRPDELLSRVRLPRRADEASWVHFYQKVGTRKFQAISKVCFAGLARVDASDGGRIASARIGLGAVAPTVQPARATEAALVGATLSDAGLEAAAMAAMRQDATPIDDVRSTARYRGNVAANLGAAFVRALREAARG